MPKSKNQQEQLITPMGLFLLVVFVIAIMALLYPSNQTLFSSMQSAEDLKALFKNPDKLKYQQTLHKTSLSAQEALSTVEALSEKGLWKEARHILSEKLPDQLTDSERREAALWMLQSHLDEYYIAQNKQGEKTERENSQQPLGSARAQLQRLEQLENLPLKELRLLAKTSLEFGLIPQAIQTYFRLAKMDKSKALDWLDQAGTQAMRIHAYSDAVRAYKWATEISPSTEEKQSYRYAWLNAANKAGYQQVVNTLLQGIETDLANFANKDAFELEKLATISLEIGRPSIAHRIYAQLAEVDSEQAKYWYEKAGVWASSNQEYQQSALYFSETEKLNSNPVEIERLQYKQYEAFTLAKMPKKALQKVQAIVDKHSNDGTLLKKGVNTALAAKAPTQARKWNSQYLKTHPKDINALQLQADIEIRDKQYLQAIAYIQRILVIDHQHLDSHKKLAFLLETQGKDVKALRQWQVIYQLDAKLEYKKHILRLAQATLKQGIGLELLLTFSQKNALPEQAVQDIVSYYIDSKQLPKAERFLSQYVKKYPASLNLWQRLVSLQQNQPLVALATWEIIEKRFGVNHKTLFARIEILWGLERTEAVYAIYTAHPRLAIKTIYHHQIMAELMWKFSRFELALQHYRYLLDHDNNQDHLGYYQRIIAIHLKQKHLAKAFNVLHTAWKNTHDSGILLQALQVAFNQNNQKELQVFLAIAKRNESLFAKNIDYWQLQAQLAVNRKGYTEALLHYKKILSLNNELMDARQGILWVLTETKQKTALRKALANWKKLATKQESLWASYALGYQALGKTRQSIVWYRHYLNKHRHDFSMLLGYADQLDKVRRHDTAYRIRTVAISQLQKSLHKKKLSSSARKEALFQYLSMVQRYGTEQEFSKLQQKLENKYLSKADQNRLNEIAIAWLLGRNEDKKLRYQLTKAHEARLKTPFWQLLALAIKKKDKAAIDNLLANAKEIRLEERVLALIASNKTTQAYKLALQGIDAQHSPQVREKARQLAIELANDHASSVQTKLTQKEIGDLTLRSIEIVYRQGIKPNFPISYDLSVQRNQLDYGDLSSHETDVSLSAQWKQDKHRIETTLGVNQSNQQNDLYYAKLRYQHQFSEGLNIAVEVGKNEVTESGSLLRAIAKRDRIKADVNAHLGKQNYLSASAWQQEFSSRKGEKLSSGQGLSAALIHKEKIGSAQWHTGVQAHIENNKTVDHLPDEIIARQAGQSIVINKPQSIGIVAGINHGSPAKGVPSVNSPRYSANAWFGKSWPEDKVTANIEASVGSRLLGGDEISATAFVNGVSGSNGQSNQGIKIQYQKWFDIDVDNQRYRIEQ